MQFLCGHVLALSLLSLVYADPPTVTEVPRPAPAKWAILKASAPIVRLKVDGKIDRWILVDDVYADLESPKGSNVATLAMTKAGRYKVIAIVDGVEVRTEVVLGDAPPPKPVDPVDPVDPPPMPVTSFRVIWVHESGATIPQAQISVMDAKAVRDYLTATTTKDGNQPGWRRWDKDVDASGDFPSFQAIWTAAKPKVTTVPCVVIEVNGKAEVLPFPATPADAVALFKKKAGK